MNRFASCAMLVGWLVALGDGSVTSDGAQPPENAESSADATIVDATCDYPFHVGVGKVDITPSEEVTLAGSPSPKRPHR